MKTGIPSFQSIQRLFLVLLIGLSTSVSDASLHPGWRESGWLTDLDSARQKSSQSGKPVFLYFDAIWCSWCQVYKVKTLDKPEIQHKLTTDYIPVVLDYDAMPQLFSRLGGKGLPFNVILNSKGDLLKSFVGLLGIEDLLALLNQYDTQGHQGTTEKFDMFEPVSITVLDQSGYREFREAFLQHIESLYSVQHKTLTGFYQSGITLKHPSPLTWMWLMNQPEWQSRVTTAAKMETQHLWDDIDRGFFQYLQRTPPLDDYLETSKLLEVNARLAQWLARSGQHSPDLLHIARQTVVYLTGVLHDKSTGAFFQSQIADQQYYQLPGDQRNKRKPPALDRIIRMDTNAQTIVALIDLAKSLQDRQLLDYAKKANQFLLSGMTRNGMRYHLFSNGKLSHPAELSDEAWLLAASLALHHASPNPVHQATLTDLFREFRLRIDRAIKTPEQEHLTPEIAGITAWIFSDPFVRKLFGTESTQTYIQWALQNIQLDSETPPDSLIFALQAWERFLINLPARTSRAIDTAF